MGSIHLGGFGLVASCCIRILAGYVLFIALTRLCSRSYVRHALWLVFLTGAGVYWSTLVAQELKPVHLTHAAIHSVSVDDLAPSSATTTIAIPYSWDRRFELTGLVLVCAYAGGLILMLSRLIRRRGDSSVELSLALSRFLPVLGASLKRHAVILEFRGAGYWSCPGFPRLVLLIHGSRWSYSLMDLICTWTASSSSTFCTTS